MNSERPIQRVLAVLERTNGCAPKRCGAGWSCQCPSHADKRPSLSIREGEDGRALLRCHAGCELEAIVATLGLSTRDLFLPNSKDKTPVNKPQRGVSSLSVLSEQSQTFPTVEDAIAAWERQLGPRDDEWTYFDANGEPVGKTLRWNKPGGKDIRPVSRNGDRWTLEGMPEPRPLYRRDEIADAPRVFIGEGEKTAEALRSIGLVATTSAHGSNAAHQTYWSPLAGKPVFILRDNDDAGEHYQDEVIDCLSALSPAPTIGLVELPGLPPHGDASDFIDARRKEGAVDTAIREEIEQLAETAELIELRLPKPAVGRYLPFPVDALPEPVKTFVVSAAQSIGCDAAYIALPLLSALAGVIGNSRRIQLKHGWTEPAILWTAFIGESGTRKTPAIKVAVNSLLRTQAAAFRAHEEAMERYERERLQYEKDLSEWKQNKKRRDDAPEKPRPPEAARFVVSDTTIEALAPILLANWRGVLLRLDELAGWVRSFDQYKQGRGGDAQRWLSMHSADAIIVDRRSGHPRTIYVPSPCVSVTGGIQPWMLDKVFGPEHRESGLLARLLLAWPPRMVIRFSEVEIAPGIDAAMDVMFERLLKLQPDRDTEGNSTPAIVRLTPAAKRAWIEFFNAHADEQIELQGALASAWSKLEGYAARLALVLHLVRLAAGDQTLPSATVVDDQNIHAGVTLSRWFGHEARRIYALWSDDGNARRHFELVERIELKGGSITPRELARSSSAYRKTSDANAALDKLVKDGVGRWEFSTPGPKGGAPSKRFVLNDTCEPKHTDTTDTDKTPHEGPVNNGSVSPDAPKVTDDDWGEL